MTRAAEPGLPRAPKSLAGIDPAEWRARLELAACYRLLAGLGWTESIFNHITVRLPGGDPHERQCLINPWGLNYEEVTASNLVKVDAAGRARGVSAGAVNPAGFVIHSAIHGARDDVHCVIHTHTTTGVAVACKAGGLRHDNFYSAQLTGRVAYHDFEGITVHLDEQPRMLASLGRRSILILRNHGLLVAAHDLPTAYWLLWTLQRACDVQALADSMIGPNAGVVADLARRCAEDADAFDPALASLVFDAALRRHGIRYADLVQ